MDRPTDRDTAATAPTAPPRPPLRRPRNGRVLAGVAAGIADHLAVDVVIVRIVIVVLAVATEGLAVLAYIAAAIFIPVGEAGAARPTRGRRGVDSDDSRGPLFWVGIAVLVVGALWLARGVTGFAGLAPGDGGFGRLVVPLVLVAFGLALWRAGDRRDLSTGDAGTSTRPTSWPPAPATTRAGAATPPGSSPSDATTEHAMTIDTTTDSAAAPPAADGASTWPPTQGDGGAPPRPPMSGQPYGEPAWTPPPEPERRPRSLLTRITLGVALVAMGVLWSLRVADVLTIGWGTIVSGALLVIGIGLLIGSLLGRGRWLILAGALLAPVVLLAQVASLPYLSAGWDVASDNAGAVRVSPTELSGLRSEYRLRAGMVRLDLRDLDFEGEDVAVDVDLGAGEIHVVVPDDIEVAASARSGIGQVQLFDVRNAAGIGAGEQRATFTPEGDPQGRIELDLRTGLGEIRVETAPRSGVSPSDREARTGLDPAQSDPAQSDPARSDVARSATEPEPATSGS